MTKFSHGYHFVLKLFLLIFILFVTDGIGYGQGKAEIIVHYVEGQPLEKTIAYEIKSYLSVVDENGEPVRGLTKENFSLTEDSKTMEVMEVNYAKEAPLNIVLVVDTSGSMRGRAVEDLRNAGQEFIARMGEEDKISVIGFNEKISTLIDFSYDHQQVMRSIQQIDAIQNSGTCLYDAAYEAVQKSATLPVGRRAVILLTDGVDETFSGGLCSIHTFEDVVALASDEQTRVPLYTIGLGNKIDQNGLQRLALLTGGKYLFSTDSEDVGMLFNDLADHLNSEYVISYLSNAAPGTHSLIVTVDSKQVQDQDTRRFLLPEFPINIKIMSHEDGQSVLGKQVLTASFTGSGAVVDHVRFMINEDLIGIDNEYPYSVEWDFSKASASEQMITVIAEDVANQPIDQEEIFVYVTLPTKEPQIQPTEAEGLILDPQENSSSESALGKGVFPFVLGGGVLLIVIVLFFILRKKQKQDIENIMASNPPKDTALAKLIIEASDDKMLVGKEIDITKTNLLLGRSLENDIVFSADTPVSRQHAVIEQKGQLFYLSQAFTTDLDGKINYPKYGTYVNEEKLEENSRLLITGDEIRLGKRVRIKFISRVNPLSHASEDATMDEIDLATMDMEHDTVDMELAQNHDTVEEQFIDTKEDLKNYKTQEDLSLDDGKTQEEQFIDPKEDLNRSDKTKEDRPLDGDKTQEEFKINGNQTMEDFNILEETIGTSEGTQAFQYSENETATFGFEAGQQDSKDSQTNPNKTLAEDVPELKEEGKPKKSSDGGETLIDQDFSDKTQF